MCEFCAILRPVYPLILPLCESVRFLRESNKKLKNQDYMLKSLKKYGTPGAIRTPDLRNRNPSLYPTELRVQGEEASIVLVFERFPLDAGSIKRIPISGKAFSPLIRNPDP